MPIYEYQCEPCVQSFETLVRGPDDVARCPVCGEISVTKLLSVPAAAHIGGSQSGGLPVCAEPSGSSSFGCGRPQCGSGVCAGLD